MSQEFADLTERTVASERVYEGRVLSLRVDTVLLPDGRTSKREIVEHRGAIAVVPLLDDGRVLLVRQFRKATEEVLLEIPAGTLDSSEEPDECAHRELIEETGYRAEKLEKLFSFYLAPGYSTEMLHAYLATQLTPMEAKQDEDEFVQLVAMPLEEAVALIDKGVIKDCKTISALLMTMRKKKEERRKEEERKKKG